MSKENFIYVEGIEMVKLLVIFFEKQTDVKQHEAKGIQKVSDLKADESFMAEKGISWYYFHVL